MGNNVCLFIKPFKYTDGANGNPVANEIITDLYRIGCTVNRVKLVNLTPKMLIRHYDELMREGRERIVYDMVGDYVSEELSKKLLAGGTLTEAEMNTPGRPVVVMDLNLPESITHFTDVRDDLVQKTDRPTMVVKGTIENFRKFVVGPTMMRSYFQMVDKVAKDNPGMELGEIYKEAMNQYIPASNSIRYKYQYTGEGAKTSFNVMHCSANETDRDFELGNFFGEWANEGTMLDADKFNAYFTERANTTAQIPQIVLNARLANNDMNEHFQVENFVQENPSNADDNISE